MKLVVCQDETKSQNIYDIPIDTFIKTTQKNITEYYYLNMFWMPIIEKRAKLHHDFAEDLLLNPIFRWCYIDTKKRLKVLEQELKDLSYVLGQDAFENYQKTIMDYMAHQNIENQAHDRMLDARAEMRGMLYYAKLGYSIILEPRQRDNATYDFNTVSKKSKIAVEAKFIRHPDKLRIYLMRWWQAQAEISGVHPLGFSPYIKFRWENLNRNELSSKEIKEIKHFFRLVFEKPDSDRKVSFGRINIMYSQDNKLEPATTPIEIIEKDTKHSVDPLIRKIRSTIEQARIQLAVPKNKGMDISCYLLLNLTSNIGFFHEKAFKNNLKDLKNEYSRYGLEIVTEEALYL